jgi:hypothetical protein
MPLPLPAGDRSVAADPGPRLWDSPAPNGSRQRPSGPGGAGATLHADQLFPRPRRRLLKAAVNMSFRWRALSGGRIE